jgi:type IV secretory pathway VirB10-like protein
MPLADESIIAPGQIQSKAPLKKSTVAWGLGMVVLLAVVGVTVPAMVGTKDSGSKATPSTTAQPGQVAQIDGEFAQAKRKVRDVAANPADPAQGSGQGSGNSEQAAASGVPLPGSSQGGRPVVPASAKRDDSSGALYGKKMDEVAPGTGAGIGNVEQDAAARLSPSIKADFGDGAVANAATAIAGAAAEAINPRAPALPASGASPADNASAANQADPVSSRISALLAAKGGGEQAAPTTGVASDRGWLKELGAPTTRTPALRAYKVTNPYTLLQGKVIPAVLGRDLNTDLPGEVTACTTMDVYDSLVSRHLLIPRGSCLAGRYSNAIAMGQERILFAFTRLTMPNGLSVDLPGNPGADLGGASGIGGDVNNHFFKMFTTSLLVALLAQKVEANKQPSATSVGGTGALSAAGEVLVDVSKTILDRNRTIPPTITVDKGTRINVEVTRDIEFDQPYPYNRP